MSQSQHSQNICELCTDILSRSFLAGGSHDSSFPVHISQVAGSTARPDLDFIHESATMGCQLCREMLRVHMTKVCNGFSGTTSESDAEEALEAVSLKFPRIEVDVVFQEGRRDGLVSHYLMVYTHTIVEDEESESEESHGEIGSNESVTKIVNGNNALPSLTAVAVTSPRFGQFQELEAKFDTDAFLQTMFQIIRSDYLPRSLFPKMTTPIASDTTSSDSSWTQCKAWLTHCTTSHNHCNKQLFPIGGLPKRLIDVGDDYHPPFLCLSQDLLPSTQYVTLSHCWGHSKVITLTSSTNPIFSTSIPLQDLSQTFRDAITITRRFSTTFGIKHLWIDSLCILQDSKEEWTEEAPRMAVIYGNCWCNLAATAGGGLSTRPAGIFSRRNPGVTKPLRISLPTSDGVQFTVVDSERWTDFVKLAPLNRRAWVCQERLLSPRILHFGVDEIYWECSSGRASETFPNGEPQVDTTTTGANETLVRTYRVEPNEADALNSWLDIVETFSACELTYTSDKLFAIAGLAKHFQSRLGVVDYLAGMWRTSIERQLLWYVVGVGLATRSEVYRAPSWCWSSIDGGIWISSPWAGEDTEVLVKVLDASITLEGIDPFGGVSSGLLRMSGRLLRCKAASDARYFPGLRLLIDEALDEIAYHADTNLSLEPSNEVALYAMPILLEHITYPGGVENAEEEPNKVEGDENTVDDGEVDVRMILRGLVLERSRITSGQYRRVGCFETVVPKEVETIMQGKEPILAETEYEAFDGYNQYAISII